MRSHWDIENGLHWVLDVSFSEDSSKVGNPNAARILSAIRKMSINMLKAVKPKKNTSIRAMRKMAGWDNDFLLKALLH